MQKKPRLFIVEDEPAIRTGLVDVFVFHGFEVESAADGREALERALRFEILRRIRAVDRDQPIILLTAKGADEDVIHGLSLGADDYVAKPFSVAQLVLRVQAVLRRSHLGADAAHRIALGDDVELDVPNLAGRRGDESLSFTRREMEVLQYLHANGDRPVSREELLTKVWGYARASDIETRTVDIHVAKLRRKIEADPAQPRHLVTVRGAGYRLLKG